MTLIDKLAAIQTKLHAPKNQKNTFGGYNYRSCEDILEAVKPLLDGLVLTITDEVTDVGGRIYVKATARLTDGKDAMTATAFAREAESRKGMDEYAAYQDRLRQIDVRAIRDRPDGAGTAPSVSAERNAVRRPERRLGRCAPAVVPIRVVSFFAEAPLGRVHRCPFVFRWIAPRYHVAAW